MALDQVLEPALIVLTCAVAGVQGHRLERLAGLLGAAKAVDRECGRPGSHVPGADRLTAERRPAHRVRAVPRYLLGIFAASLSIMSDMSCSKPRTDQVNCD